MQVVVVVLLILMLLVLWLIHAVLMKINDNFCKTVKYFSSLQKGSPQNVRPASDSVYDDRVLINDED